VEDDSDALAAQYREARDAIGPHRAKQAKAEVAYAEALQRNGGDPTTLAVLQAKTAMDQAVVDVDWCKAAAVAAAEQYKGCSFVEAIERNEANRAHMATLRSSALGQIVGDD